MIRYSLLFAGLLSFPAIAQEHSAWEDIAGIVFEDRFMLSGDDFIEAQIPYRTSNDLHEMLGARLTSPDDVPIQTVYLVLDENPMPISLQISPLQPLTDLAFEASFRINRSQNTHIVMELEDGRLFVEENYIKTSGTGACAAPPGTDVEEALETIGIMTLSRREPNAASLLQGATSQLHISISHPQHSGMQLDQITLLYIPARFVTNVEIAKDDVPWLALEGSISLSENPEIAVGWPDQAKSFNVTLEDNEGLTRETGLRP